MKTTNVIYNINRIKTKKTSNKKKISYECIFHCPTNINDCINSIDMIDDKVVFGTLMGNVYLCRVDEKKLNKKNDEFLKINKKKENENRRSSSTENIENDESKIKLNNNNSNSKCDCIKLTINNNENNLSERNDEIANDDNVKIFNKKNKNNSNNNIAIILNNHSENNHSRKINNEINNDNKNYTNEENGNDEDENSNKYEKKLINKNMGKTSSQINGNIQINKDSKIFNEKQEQNKNNKTKNKDISFPQITKLIFRFKENIPCLEFENNDIIYISLGDLEVITFQNMSTFNMNDETSTYNYSKLRNYKLENDHIQYCENSTCMMGNACFLIVFTEFANFNNILEEKDIRYENKNLKTFEIVKGTIKLSNYVVPFDFDGDKFLFLDYLSKEERKISVFFTASKKPQYNYIIKNRKFGHISHMKLLPNNKIFLCRNNKECEIHLMNKNFDEIEKWVHLGEDVISCYIYLKNKKKLYGNINNKDSNKLNESDNNDDNEDDNEYSDEDNNEKSLDEINKNLLKLLENKALTGKASKKVFININQTINIATIQHNGDKTNKYSAKKNEKNLISSNGNENSYNHTESNQIIFNKKKLLRNNLHSLNPSFDNSSRREINFTVENKRFTSNRNSKTNSATKYNLLLTSDKKKKNSKNTLSSIEIYGKKRQNGIKNKLKKISIINGSDGNEEDQTIINNRENDIYSIYTLDKDGSVNVYNNKIQKNLFNLYNMNNIDSKFKKLEFFSVGFPYYIVANDIYYGITTDHGLFVISRNIE